MGANTNLDEFMGVGTVLAGKYRVERVVGTGGMGVVAVARHLRLGRRVAVKVMLPRPEDSERSVARFLREARTASRITSSHVARVFDVDLREDGIPYIVMEYLEGDTLAAIIRRESALDVEGSVDDLLAACETLAEAHALGIVHRDLKPGNLFRSCSAGRRTHVLKVLDFGISKTFETGRDEVASITTGKSFVGSPPYMSPEQITSPASVDSRTDIWSLGVVLYECLTGISPFAAATVGATCARILHETPAPPSELRSELPAALDERVLRCLTKDPAGRYQTILELARELAPFASAGSGRSLSSIESHWATGPRGSDLDTAFNSEVGDLSTETAVEPVPSLAVLVHSTFRRLPRGFGVGGVVALTVLIAGLAVVATPRLRGKHTETRPAARQSDSSVASIPPVVLPATWPVSPALSIETFEAPVPTARPKPLGSVRAQTEVRSRPQSSSVPLPSAASSVAEPVTSATESDPEAIYTYRK
jgi:serine/threonine protein kinase